MTFSAKHFIDQCYENYRQAMELEAEGNYSAASEKLSAAADYLLRSTEYDTGVSREKNLALVKRMQHTAQLLTKKAALVPSATPNTAASSEAASAVGRTPAEGANSFFTFIPADQINVTFDDVIGLESAKAAVIDYVINPLLYPDQFNYHFLENKGILLEGPAGTGKTTFAKAVAHEVNQPFALIKMSQLVDCYVGETAKHIDEVFAYLRDYTQKYDCGVTVFFDEFDEIGKSRGGDDKSSEAAVPALLRNLDGVASNKNFLIIANTNCIEALDKALVNRFRRRIYVPLPNVNDRKKLFEAKLSDIEEDYLHTLDLELMATHSEGLGGRDITFVCDDFKYYLSRLKAGITTFDDINQSMLELIEARKI